MRYQDTTCFSPDLASFGLGALQSPIGFHLIPGGNGTGLGIQFVAHVGDAEDNDPGHGNLDRQHAEPEEQALQWVVFFPVPIASLNMTSSTSLFRKPV